MTPHLTQLTVSSRFWTNNHHKWVVCNCDCPASRLCEKEHIYLFVDRHRVIVNGAKCFRHVHINVNRGFQIPNLHTNSPRMSADALLPLASHTQPHTAQHSTAREIPFDIFVVHIIHLVNWMHSLIIINMLFSRSGFCVFADVLRTVDTSINGWNSFIAFDK